MLHVTFPDEEEQKNNHAAEECENIKDKESNTKLKSHWEFYALSDDTVCSANIIFIKHHDRKQLEK